MSTADILVASIQTAQTEMGGERDLIIESARKISEIKKEHRTQEEKDILTFAHLIETNVPLINIVTAFSVGGLNEQRLPALGMAPYEHSMSRKKAEVRINPMTGFVRFGSEFDSGWHLSIPAGTFSFTWLEKLRLGTKQAETAIPTVPMELRDHYKNDVFLLFEVPKWENVMSYTDPYLIKHIAGFVYAILGSWDLTNKEVEAFRLSMKLGL